MEKEKVKEMLDVMADAVKTLAKFEEYICVSCIIQNELQLHNTARSFAQSMELELMKRPWKCGNATATYISFEYEGVTFYELENYMVGEES